MSGIIGTVGSKSGVVGSDIYPAGHIIQVKGTNNYHPQLFDTGYGIIVELSLTNVLASSHVAIWTTLTININNTGSEGLETHIMSHTASMGSVGNVSTPGTDASGRRKIQATGGNESSATFTYVNDADDNFYLSCPFMCIDTAPVTGTNFYALTGSEYDAGAVMTHDGNRSILLMEIAQ